MVTSLRASNCRFRNENLLKRRGSEDIGTANLRAQRLSVICYQRLGVYVMANKAMTFLCRFFFKVTIKILAAMRVVTRQSSRRSGISKSFMKCF